MNNRTAGDHRITALYERLSRDDDLAGDSNIQWKDGGSRREGETLRRQSGRYQEY